MVYTVSKELRQFVEEGTQQNPFAVLSRLVYGGVYREVMEGRLTIEDTINISQLAETLNLSRTPVKIAMDDLVCKGVLEKRQGNKLSVKRLTFEECSLLYEARIQIESASAYYAARRVTAEELEELQRLLVEFQEYDKTQNGEGFVRCDKNFHDLVVKASKNSFLVDAYKSLEASLQRYRFQVIRLLSYKDMCHRNGIQEIDYHQCIYESLRGHLPIEARNAVYRDVERMHGTMYMIKFN